MEIHSHISPSFAIVAAADATMLPGACTALLSARRNSDPGECRYFVIVVNGSDREMELVAAFSRKHSFEIIPIPYASTINEKKHFPGRLSAAALARLDLDALIPASFERLLYLDSDVLVVSDLMPLIRTELNGCLLGAVPDSMEADKEETTARLLSASMNMQWGYFNSGVILFDWITTLEKGVLRNTRQWLLASGGTRFPDQDAINVVVGGKWHRLQPKWNVTSGLLHVVDRPAIIHFTGPRKPWDDRPFYPFIKWRPYYREALKGLPWESFVKRMPLTQLITSYSKYLKKLFRKRARREQISAHFSSSDEG